MSMPMSMPMPMPMMMEVAEEVDAAAAPMRLAAAGRSRSVAAVSHSSPSSHTTSNRRYASHFMGPPVAVTLSRSLSTASSCASTVDASTTTTTATTLVTSPSVTSFESLMVAGAADSLSRRSSDSSSITASSSSVSSQHSAWSLTLGRRHHQKSSSSSSSLFPSAPSVAQQRSPSRAASVPITTITTASTSTASSFNSSKRSSILFVNTQHLTVQQPSSGRRSADLEKQQRSDTPAAASSSDFEEPRSVQLLRMQRKKVNRSSTISVSPPSFNNNNNNNSGPGSLSFTLRTQLRDVIVDEEPSVDSSDADSVRSGASKKPGRRRSAKSRAQLARLAFVTKAARVVSNLTWPRERNSKSPHEELTVRLTLDKDLMRADKDGLFGYIPRMDEIDTRLIVFAPPTFSASNDTPYPLHIHLHGGGFIAGNAKMTTALLHRKASEVGCIVVSIDYVKAPEYQWPHAPEQIFAAFQWLVDPSPSGGATRYNIDPTRISVGGCSAGASLAAILCSMAHARQGSYNPLARINLLVAAYPPANLTIAYATRMQTTPPSSPIAAKSLPVHVCRHMEHSYIPFSKTCVAPDYLTRMRHHMLSPSFHTPEQMRFVPRAIVLTADWDLLAVDGDEYADRLRDAGVRVTHKRYEKTTHGFLEMHEGQRDHNPYSKEDAVRTIIDAMQDVFSSSLSSSSSSSTLLFDPEDVAAAATAAEVSDETAVAKAVSFDQTDSESDPEDYDDAVAGTRGHRRYVDAMDHVEPPHVGARSRVYSLQESWYEVPFEYEEQLVN